MESGDLDDIWEAVGQIPGVVCRRFLYFDEEDQLPNKNAIAEPQWVSSNGVIGNAAPYGPAASLGINQMNLSDN